MKISGIAESALVVVASGETGRTPLYPSTRVVGMFVITNRSVLEGASGLYRFGKTPNQKCVNECRLPRVARQGRAWR